MTYPSDTIGPSANNRERVAAGLSEHAAPAWMRILSGCSATARGRSWYKPVTERKTTGHPVRWTNGATVLTATSMRGLARLLGCTETVVSLSIRRGHDLCGGKVERI